MSTLIKILLCAFLVLLFGCKSEPTLQKYFVEKKNDNQFQSLDLDPSMLKLDSNALSIKQNEALNSFEKVNILICSKPEKTKLSDEAQKINQILADKKYQTLIKIGSGKQEANLSFTGTDNAIDEFIVYGNHQEKGLALVRVTGNNMNVNHVITLMGLIQKSNFDQEKIKPLLNLLK